MHEKVELVDEVARLLYENNIDEGSWARVFGTHKPCWEHVKPESPTPREVLPLRERQHYQQMAQNVLKYLSEKGLKLSEPPDDEKAWPSSRPQRPASQRAENQSAVQCPELPEVRS